jgi:hypothetical protein
MSMGGFPPIRQEKSEKMGRLSPILHQNECSFCFLAAFGLVLGRLFVV